MGKTNRNRVNLTSGERVLERRGAPRMPYRTVLAEKTDPADPTLTLALTLNADGHRELCRRNSWGKWTPTYLDDWDAALRLGLTRWSGRRGS